MGAASTDDLYLDEPWVSIRWDNIHKCVRTEWKAFANSAEYRACQTKALEVIREREAIRYLSDTRMVKVIVHKDQAWANEVWLPLLVEAGVKRYALVTAASGLGKVTVDELIALVADRGLLMKAFDSVDTSLAWLAEA